MKFAFILNTNGGHPDTYNVNFTTASEENWIYGVTGVEEGVEFAKTLKEKGFDLVNLCGDFDEEMTAEVAATGIEACNAKYLPAEMDKIGDLTDEQLCEYGIIIVSDEVNDIEAIDKKDAACNIYVRFVADEDAACEAAKDVIAAGAEFMELCSWYDREKTEKVIAAIDGKVPVGTCGEI